MSEALKSCPFCGSPAELRQGHLILCMNEEENGCLVDPLVQSLTDEETVAAWNTRPVEDALVEALKAAEVMLRALLVSTPCSVSTNDSGKFRNINSFGTLKEVQAALKLAAE